MDLFSKVLVQKAIPLAHLLVIIPLIWLDIARAAEHHLIERPECQSQTQPIQGPIDKIVDVRTANVVIVYFVIF